MRGDAPAAVDAGIGWQDFVVPTEVNDGKQQWSVEDLKGSLEVKPLSSTVRRFRPADKILDDQEKAKDKNNPHGLKHFAETFVLQEVMAKVAEERGVKLRRNVLRWAAVLHDMAGMGERRANHAEISAEWAQNNLADSMDQDDLTCLVGVLKWHEADDDQIPPEAWSEELKYFKDSDTAGLIRVGADKSTLRMRTEEGKKILDVAALLITEGNRVNTGDAYEDVIQAAENLELLEASGRVNVFRELVKENSFIAHGVSGNYEGGQQIKTASEVWKSIFKIGKLVNPESRKESWSEAEQGRYGNGGSTPGDRARVYGYVANEDVGIGGKSYMGDGMILAPTRAFWMDGVFINSDQDKDIRSVTPVSMTKYDSDGGFIPIEIPLSECLVVLPVEAVIDQIDDIVIFCEANGLKPEEWIRTHVIIADPSSVEEESLLREASRRCKQQGELLVQETELTNRATHEYAQLTTEIVRGTKEVRVAGGNVEFLSPENISTPRLLQKRLDEYVRLAEDSYFSREKSDYYRYGRELMAIAMVANIFGLDEKRLMNQAQIQEYFRELEKTVRNEDGWLNENATMQAIFPDAKTGTRQRFNGKWYEKNEGGWESDRMPSYDEY